MATWHETARALITTGDQDESGGTGQGFGRWVIIVTGTFALVAILLTMLTILLQAKNYRKPLLQRHVVRILVMVPIFCAASWASLTSLRVAFYIDPLRDVYEAFTIYSFFQLLVNFLGGERSLIIMMHGRPPVQHLWPLNHVFGKVDISDPHSFLWIKRGILQYAVFKPILAIATIVCKATGTFREGIVAVNSGYFWTALIYNISIFWSLYDLALFWVCMSQDLQPFRPMPKFLCIKGIIFASWWQGFFLSILVFLGIIPSLQEKGYTADNLAAAIQDALICFEMPFFAVWQLYAFSWKDYADRTISDARMPLRFALRDAFGARDLIEDCKETFSGERYEYRYFDAEDNVIAHEESASRRARMREGMRYERNGRGKYWVPSPTESRQPLLGKFNNARTMSPAGGSGSGKDRSTSRGTDYGTSRQPEEPELDAEEERLYRNARALEFGDWNYPVINTHFATRDDRVHTEPHLISASTNRALLQPTKENRQRRRSRIEQIRESVHQHDRPATSSSQRSSDASGSGSSKAKETLRQTPVVGKFMRSASRDSKNSAHSRSSQLVDLVVEDHEAEKVERVRARKEGGPGWNSVEQKHFVKTYPDEHDAEEVRQGFNPDAPEQRLQEENHSLTDPFAIGDGEDEMPAVSEVPGRDQTGGEQPWEEREYAERSGHEGASPMFEEERNVWGEDR